jgi:hypothetical protein
MIENKVKKNDFHISDDGECEILYSFHEFPIHMGVTNKPQDNDLYSDLVITIEKNSGLLRLETLIQEDVLYVDAHYNSIGAGWEKHHRAFAQFIAKYAPQNIFEIGGGRGLLEKYYNEDNKTNWTILEPVPNPVEGCNATFIKGFFDEDYVIPSGYDAVVHSHTLEHFYNPIHALKTMSKSMPNESYMFFSIPNMKTMFERCFTNVMNYEHTFYCAEPYVEYMMNVSGYKVIEKMEFGIDHSIFYAAKKMDLCETKISFEGYFGKNKKMFQKYIDTHVEIVNRVNNYLSSNSQPVYLFGAHVFSQFLFGFGMNKDKIIAILDNDKSKQGFRLCGTNLQVFSPQVLKDVENPVVILRAGTHSEEIKKDILQNINSNVVFWE